MSNLTKKQIGGNLRRLRVQKNYSQEEVSEFLGIPRPSVSQIESGERDVTSLELDKFSALYNVPCDYILSEKGEADVVLEREEGKKKKKEFRDSRPQIAIDKSRVNKFKQVLLYLLERTAGKSNVGETVINKLLYFIDFNYYELYEEQLIGATYLKNHHGPTPIELKKVLDKMIEEGLIEKIKRKHFDFEQTRYLPNSKPDLKDIKASEIKVIDDVIERLSDFSAKSISEFSHADVPWLATKEGEKIDYEAVFYRTPAYSVRSYEDDEI